MSALTKAIGAATRLVRIGDTTEATRVIREALTGGLSPKSLDKADAATPDKEAADPFCCFGPDASAPDLGKRLAEWTASAQMQNPAVRTGRTPVDEAPASGTGMVFLRRSYTSGEGSLGYKIYQPGQRTPAALIVMLHGCKQNADDFARGTRMNALAEQHDMVVVYPEQTHAANVSGCWNWFDPKHQRRGTGEPATLAGLTRSVSKEFGVEPGRIFVAGLSAGGAMAAVLAETYPDLFAGVGIHSGLAYAAASDVSSALSAMQGNGGGTGLGMNWMRPGAVSAPLHAGGRVIPTIVFHGDADHTVHRDNADAILARITAQETGLRSETLTGVAPGGEAYSRTVGCDGHDTVRYESWTIKGAGHAWSGGSREGSYTDPNGPDASAEMVRFFLGLIPPG